MKRPNLLLIGLLMAIAIQPVSNGAIYDLQGRRVVKPLKGIYVKNGKKLIIK
jgi:hypothetical protein